MSAQSQGSSTQETEDGRMSTVTEAEAYLSTPPVNANEFFTILGWWKTHAEDYPRLAQVAKDILAVQIAEVGVERVFSLARDVIGNRRHRLAPKTIQRVMVLKDSISYEMDQDSIGSPDPDSDEDQAPYEEVTDLHDLHHLDRPRAGFDSQPSDSDDQGQSSCLDSSETNNQANNQANNYDYGLILRLPRTRKRPARFLE